MTRGILIVGNESPTLAAVASAAHARVDSIVKAFAPNRMEGAARQLSLPAGNSADSILPWNPSSSVSARTLVVGAGNRLGRIDEAILVCAPPAIRRRADELSPADLDTMADDLVKGWFLVVRELAAVFRVQQSGTLALVLSESGLAGSKDDAPDLIGCAVAASFRAFSQGLLAASFKEPYKVIGFSTADADEAGFAEYVLKALDEGRGVGKWNKFGKGGLFGLL